MNTRICSIAGCGTDHRARGFCNRHYLQYKTGKIDELGNPLVVKYQCMREGCSVTVKKPDSYCSLHRWSQPGLCRLCSKTKIVHRGLCTTHYSRYRKGIIDINGNELKPLKKKTYLPNEQCRIKGCGKKPRGHGLCRQHSDHLRWGWIDERGRRLKDFRYQNQNKTCKAPKCDKPALKREYCQRHYERWKKGYLRLEDSPRYRKYHGYGTCCVEGCKDHSIRDTYCRKHYLALTEMQFNAQKKPTDEQAPKLCLIKNCLKPAKAKKLCAKCYSHWKRRLLNQMK